MANPILNINGTHELLETYSTVLVPEIMKQAVIRNTFNRYYQQLPTGRVKIAVRNNGATMQDYDIENGITMGASSTTYRELDIKHHKGFGEYMYGHELEALPYDVVSFALGSAGRMIVEEVEKTAIDALVTDGTASSLGATSSANIYEQLVDTITDLMGIGLNPSDVIVAVSSKALGYLLKDDKFITNTASEMGAVQARTGQIGMVAGSSVLYAPMLRPDQYDFIVYSTEFVTAVDFFETKPQIVPIYDGKKINTVCLQGVLAWGDYVLKPETVIYKAV